MHCSFLLWRKHFTMKRNTMSTKSFEKSNCFYFPIILNNCTRPPTPARLKGLGLIWFNLGFNQTYNHSSTDVGEMQQIVVQQTNHQRGRISFHSWLLGNDDALGWWWRWWWCSWCFHRWRWCFHQKHLSTIGRGIGLWRDIKLDLKWKIFSILKFPTSKLVISAT